MNDMQLEIDGTPVAALSDIVEKTSFAISVDGFGEVFLNQAGRELSGEELDQISIRVVYLSESALFGL